MNNQNIHEESWWERNKKKVLIIGGVIVIVGVSYMLFKNKNALLSLIKSSKKITDKSNLLSEKAVIDTTSEIIAISTNESAPTNMPINNGLPFEVKGFIRNLPNGQHPSPEKVAQALEAGIVLGENQTLVDAYVKNAA